MRNEAKDSARSPDVLGERVVLVDPRSRPVDRLAVDGQPLAHLPQSLLEHRHDPAVVGRPDVHEQVAAAAAKHTHHCVISAFSQLV